ncbi:MAG: hypothetical protein AAB358_01805 [Patescibacteria group bacterium]
MSEGLRKNIFIKNEKSDEGADFNNPMKEDSNYTIVSEFVKEKELEKSKELSELIDSARKIVHNEAREFGVEVNVFNDRNLVHLLPHDTLLSIFSSHNPERIPTFTATDFGIWLDADKLKDNKVSELEKILLLVHEFLHQSSVHKFSQFIDQEGRVHVRPYQKGYAVGYGATYQDVKKSRRLFFGLNEAITQYLTRLIYIRKISKDPRFAEQVEQLEKKLTTKQKEEGKTVLPNRFSGVYYFLESLFKDLYESIYKRHQDDFEDDLEVRNKFFYHYFNGDLPGAGKLIRKLGDGAFTDLANIDLVEGDDTLHQIINFRKKYGLPEDKNIEQALKMIKK